MKCQTTGFSHQQLQPTHELSKGNEDRTFRATY